jgi:YggT family protein
LIGILIIIVSVVAQLLFWVVIIDVLLSYFMDPYHPVRRALDGIVQPMLAPIRRILPPLGGFDFSPFVLLILLQLLANIIIRLLSTLR